jgi:hypothetical protein
MDDSQIVQRSIAELHARRNIRFGAKTTPPARFTMRGVLTVASGYSTQLALI